MKRLRPAVWDQRTSLSQALENAGLRPGQRMEALIALGFTQTEDGNPQLNPCTLRIFEPLITGHPIGKKMILIGDGLELESDFQLPDDIRFGIAYASVKIFADATGESISIRAEWISVAKLEEHEALVSRPEMLEFESRIQPICLRSWLEEHTSMVYESDQLRARNEHIAGLEEAAELAAVG